MPYCIHCGKDFAGAGIECFDCLKRQQGSADANRFAMMIDPDSEAPPNWRIYAIAVGVVLVLGLLFVLLRGGADAIAGRSNKDLSGMLDQGDKIPDSALIVEKPQQVQQQRPSTAPPLPPPPEVARIHHFVQSIAGPTGGVATSFSNSVQHAMMTYRCSKCGDTVTVPLDTYPDPGTCPADGGPHVWTPQGAPRAP
jgi:DNA-directed RNA polymerase subunit RPC12/RpoP